MPGLSKRFGSVLQRCSINWCSYLEERQVQLASNRTCQCSLAAPRRTVQKYTAWRRDTQAAVELRVQDGEEHQLLDLLLHGFQSGEIGQSRCRPRGQKR